MSVQIYPTMESGGGAGNIVKKHWGNYLCFGNVSRHQTHAGAGAGTVSFISAPCGDNCVSVYHIRCYMCYCRDMNNKLILHTALINLSQRGSRADLRGDMIGLTDQTQNIKFYGNCF